jgi:hypothetical protein
MARANTAKQTKEEPLEKQRWKAARVAPQNTVEA